LASIIRSASQGKRPNEGARRRSCRALAVLFFSLVIVTGCRDRGQTRPPGMLRLGPVDELARQPETHLTEQKILLRFDGKGFSAMSTACTYDLSALFRIETPEAPRWGSSYSESSYANDGSVLHGPAKASLPFFELRSAKDFYYAPSEILYVKVGEEVPSTWRLPFPSQLLPTQVSETVDR
jgi:hypothetical protein